jgi:hypothetical protein
MLILRAPLQHRRLVIYYLSLNSTGSCFAHSYKQGVDADDDSSEMFLVIAGKESKTTKNAGMGNGGCASLMVFLTTKGTCIIIRKQQQL